MSQTKPDIREQIGVAVNAKNLQTRSYEVAVDRVAAVGSATLAMRIGAAVQDLPIAAMRTGDSIVEAELPPPNAQEYIAAELSAMLWHLVYGRQVDLRQRTATVFAAWLRERPRLRECTDTEISILAMRTLDEMFFDRCAACSGTGKQEITQNGNRVRPRGTGNRGARFVTCRHCEGTTRPLPSHPARMALLGLTREKYDAAKWGFHFAAAHAWLTTRIARMKRPLTAELERRTRRP